MSDRVDQLQGYSCEDAADLLGISAESVRRMLTRGELHGRLIGNRWRVPRFEIERWWRQGERPVATVVEMNRRLRG